MALLVNTTGIMMKKKKLLALSEFETWKIQTQNFGNLENPIWQHIRNSKIVFPVSPKKKGEGEGGGGGVID